MTCSIDGCDAPVLARGWCCRHGTNPEGESHYRAALTEADVIAIRLLVGRKSQSQIAMQFGVSRGCVTGIIHRKNWKHVP